MHKIIAGIFIGSLILAVGAYLLLSKPQDRDQQDWSYLREGEETIIYESEAETSKDCTSWETFDAGQKVCRFDCSSPAECAQIEKEINAELDSLGDEYVESAKNFSEREEGDAANVAVAKYRVHGDESISLLTGEAKKAYQDAWDIFAKISPNTFTGRFVETYEVVQNAQDDAVAQKKVSFFYTYPELVQLRTEMRKEIGGVVLERKRGKMLQGHKLLKMV